MLLTVGIVGHRKAKVLVKDRRNFQCSSKCWTDLTVERFPGSILDGPICPLAPFGIPGSILDGQIWPLAPSILQVAIKGHLSLELGLYSTSRPVSLEHSFTGTWLFTI